MSGAEREMMAQRWLDAVSDALNLGAWTIGVKVVHNLADADGAPLEGSCDAKPDYLHADIAIDSALVDEDADSAHLREVLFHECLHVALAPIAEWHEHVVNITSGKGWQRRNLLTAHGRAVEPVIVRLTRSLCPIVERQFLEDEVTHERPA